MMEKYDAIIIGFGKGGKTLAVDLAKRGWKVAVIEQSDKMYGGTCINIGCIPTKVLVWQAKIAAEHLNFSFERKREFYRQSILRKDEIVNMLRQKNYHNLADNKNITVYTGKGAFVSPRVVSVANNDRILELTADHIFINTGAETIIPSIAGIKNNPYIYTSTSIMNLTDLPEHLIIVGGGYIGLEFASMYASFGSKVTVLEGYTELMPREDRDIAQCVVDVLSKKKINFCMNAKVESIYTKNTYAVVSYVDAQTNERYELNANAVLLATGKKPNIDSLNLDVAGIEVNDKGAILVNEYLKTTNPIVWALGDVKGGLQFTYISLDDYRIIREDLFGNKKRNSSDRNPVAYSVFIDPPLSRIGLNEKDAEKMNIAVDIKKLPVSAIPRAHTLGQTEGLFKAIISPETNKILGCTLFGAESSEIINIVALAMKTKQESDFLRDFIFTHPSMSEALNDLFS